MNSVKYINPLLTKLKERKSPGIRDKIFVGFDGYIDKIQKAVETRSAETVNYYKTLTAFSERIANAAGKSGQVELVTGETKIGGNAPIMANALGHLGMHCVCLGNAGYPVKNLMYEQLHPKVELLSIGDPAETNALEFNDGKLILSELSTFRKIDWAYIKRIIGLEAVKKKIDECAVIALVGWCNPDHATDVWKGILNEIMPFTTRKLLLFFDLADPSKKSRHDLIEVLEVISGFSQYGPVILGINENETLKLFDILNQNRGKKLTDLQEKGRYIFSKMNFHALLIHPTDGCLLIKKDGLIQLDGKLVVEPRISTGGGDNLNAGFCAGRLLGFSEEESLIFGMATSGAYVKNGQSPEIQDVINWLQSWE